MQFHTSKKREELYSDSLLSVVFLGVMHEKVSLPLLSRFLPRLKSPMGDPEEQERGGEEEDKARGKGVESDLP